MKTAAGILPQAAGLIGLLALAICQPALAWTTPGPVIMTGQDSLDPRLSVDGAGKAHVVWRERIDGGLFHVWYSTNAGGAGFGSPETVSQGGSIGGGSPVVAANGQDVHVAWIASLGDNFEIWYRKRNSVGWGSVLNASNTAIKSLRPAIAARGSVGPVVAWDEAVYADDNYDTYFAEWAGTGFTPAINIANTAGGAVYGSVNVNTAVSPTGDVTAVWADRISGSYHVNARRRVAGTWQARQELSTLETGPATPGIAVGPDNRLHVVYEAQGTIWYHVHTGSSWSAPAALPGGLNSGIRPRVAVDENGVAYVVADAFTDSQNNRDIFHTNNFAGSWSAWTNLSNTAGTQSLNAEIGYAMNVLTVTWQENSNGQGGTGVYNTWYVVGPRRMNLATGTIAGVVFDGQGAGLPGATVNVGGAYETVTAANGSYAIPGVYAGTYSVSGWKTHYTTQTTNNVSITAGGTTNLNFTISTSPPAPVPSFAATGGNTANTLAWTNPISSNFAGTIVKAKLGGYPTGPEDGVLVADRPAIAGSADSVVHSGLNNGTAWYYAAFAYAGMAGRSYAAGVHAAATPAGPGDFDRDGDVDQADFGDMQLCLTGSFAPQTNSACQRARFDSDDDVDDADVLKFINCMSGPGTSSDPGCAS